MKKRPATGPARVSWSILDPPRYRERLAFSLAISVYVHVLILLLRFGTGGFGLPWDEELAQRPPLSLRLEHSLRAPPSVPVAVTPSAPQTTVTAERPEAATPPRAVSSFEVRLARASDAAPPPPELSVPQRETRAAAPAAKTRARDRKIRPKPPPQILARSAPAEETFKVPRPKPPQPEPPRAPESAAKKQTEEPVPAAQPTEQAARKPAEEIARLEAEETSRQRAEDDARQRALALQKELEARKQAEARRLEEARKQEEARRLALELEARKLAEETARKEAEELARERALAQQKEQEAVKLEEARKIEEARKQEELKKQEEARRLALEVEALKRAEEAARQQAAARQKELEARRQAEEAAARAKETAERQRQEGEAAAKREGERRAAEKAPAPGPLSGKDLAAKALEQLRTPGAARDDVLRQPAPPVRAESPRRRSLIGVERDVALRMYVEGWRSKLERNGALNYRRSAGMRAPDNPIVTVSIRSDGSVEDVMIHRSSGLREIDEAVRRIVRLYAPYSAFPPDLARQYDVLEIRRVWFFEDTLRILDEM